MLGENDIPSDVKKALFSETESPDTPSAGACPTADAHSSSTPNHTHQLKLLSPRLVTPPSPSEEDEEFEETSIIKTKPLKTAAKRTTKRRKKGKKIVFNVGTAKTRKKLKENRMKWRRTNGSVSDLPVLQYGPQDCNEGVIVL